MKLPLVLWEGRGHFIHLGQEILGIIQSKYTLHIWD